MAILLDTPHQRKEYTSMTLTDVLLVTTNSCTLVIKPKSSDSIHDMVICKPNNIPLSYLDKVVEKITPLDKNLLLITIWK